MKATPQSGRVSGPLHLGIAVTNGDAMTHLLGLVRAAHQAGLRIDVFLTGDGVALTQRPDLAELTAMARVGVCEVSFLAQGFDKLAVPALADRDFVTQARNAELVEHCHRYLVL